MMKNGLLGLCVWVGLFNTQIMDASGVNENRPDSVYTYQGKNKTLYSGAAIRYDEDGRKILEEGYLNRNGDNLLDERDQAYRIDYVYTEMEGRLKVEEINRQLTNQEWKASSRIVQLYDRSNPEVPVERYDYSAYNGGWLLFGNTIGTEFDEKGLPVVLMDTIFDIYPVILGTAEVAAVSEVTRFEVTYNDEGMPEVHIEFTPDEESEKKDVWVPYRKREYIYNGQNLQNDAFYYYQAGDWAYSYAYTYTYDEKGNRTSMIRVEEEGFGSETYYENRYLSGGNSNEIVTDLSSKVKITFADGYLRVTFEEEALFDVSVHNMQGALVAQRAGNYQEAVLTIKNAASGIYLVRLTSGAYIHTRKFLKK